METFIRSLPAFFFGGGTFELYCPASFDRINNRHNNITIERDHEEEQWVNLSIDYAVGKDSDAFYFRIGEAF